jgi:hypothetical protein
MLTTVPGLRFAALVSLAFLTACGTPGTGNTPPGSAASAMPGQSGPQGFSNFPDMPMPSPFDLDVGKTMVVGGAESWFGQMTLTTRFSANDIFDFYKQEMPRYGWEELTSIRAPVSVLTYTRQDRIATIQVASRTIYGSEIRVTVSPRGAPGGGSGSGLMPPMSSSPAPSIQVQPLR